MNSSIRWCLRYGPDGLLDSNFVRRVQHEVRHAVRMLTLCHLLGYSMLQAIVLCCLRCCCYPLHAQVDILQHLGPSLNVAYCYGAYEERGCVGIVMELLTGGELFSRIREGHYSEKGDQDQTCKSSANVPSDLGIFVHCCPGNEHKWFITAAI